MAHANPIQIQKYLKGVDYPATREQLIENAKNLGADESVCASLEQLPDEDFQTPAEVSQAFKGPSSGAVQSEGAKERSAPEPEAAGANEFLIQVMEDSLAEMELCMLALGHSGSDEVRGFAQTMLDEHGKLGQEIETMAQSMNVQFPKKMRSAHTALLREMAKLQGNQFDCRFMEQNLHYHENDLKVFQHYATGPDGGPVKKLAETGARLFGKHLKMVKELALKLER